MWKTTDYWGRESRRALDDCKGVGSKLEEDRRERKIMVSMSVWVRRAGEVFILIWSILSLLSQMVAVRNKNKTSRR